MPQTDSLGQQVPYPLLTDKPNAQTAFSNLVDAVTPKLNMTFPSASVRGAIVTEPAPGMVTWIQDTGRLEVYDGTAWVAFSVGTTLWTDIELLSGYEDGDVEKNNNQGPVQYRVINLNGVDAIMFRGGVGITYVGGAAPNGGRFNTELLPSSIRPAFIRTIPLACSALNTTTSTVKLDINTDGTLEFVGISDAKDSPPWVSLNGAVCPL